MRRNDLEWTPPDTRPSPLTVRLVGVYDGARKGGVYRAYDGPYAMQNFLASELTNSNRNKTFYAHAGGLADIQFVLEEVVRQNDPRWRVSAAMAGSAAIIVALSNGSSTWTFCDSFWLMRTSLRHIGEAIGDEKGGKDYYCTNFPDCGHSEGTCIFWAPDSILRDYNEADCRILWKAIDRFQAELLDLGGTLKKTIASCALHLFRSRFLKREIYTKRDLNERWRQCYTASRVEVYRPKGSGVCYDINSSFPASMREPAPGNLIGTGKSLPDSGLYIAECRVKVPDMYLPPLPYRKGGKVYFPVGQWEGQFTNVDLQYLEEKGGSIDRVSRVWRFEEFTDLRDYVDVIYELRKNESDESFKKLVYKYLLNSLYGKFSERETKERLLIHPDDTSGLRCLSPGIFVAEEEMELRHTHVPIAAHITALSRRLISRWIDAALKGGSVFYCDTDSVFTDSHLPTSPALGDMKKEYDFEEGVFAAPKLYRVDQKVKAKGFSGLTVSEFDTMVREVWKDKPFQERTSKTITRMRRLKELYAKSCITPLEVDIEKRISLSERPKRRAWGNDTIPWSVDEIEKPWK